MRNSKTNTGTSKKTQDLIFATVVFVGAILVFMLIYSATSGTQNSGENIEEPPLSPNHEDTIHLGTNIPAEEQEKAALQNTETKKAQPYGEVKWNKKKVRQDTKKEPSTYEREEKVVRPENAGGVR